MTALATQPTGPPIIPPSSSRIASLERVSPRPESLLDCARRRRLALDAACSLTVGDPARHPNGH